MATVAPVNVCAGQRVYTRARMCAPLRMRLQFMRKGVVGEKGTLQLSSVTGKHNVARHDNSCQVLSNFCQDIGVADDMRNTFSPLPGPNSCAPWRNFVASLRDVLRDFKFPVIQDHVSYLS